MPAGGIQDLGGLPEQTGGAPDQGIDSVGGNSDVANRCSAAEIESLRTCHGLNCDANETLDLCFDTQCLPEFEGLSNGCYGCLNGTLDTLDLEGAFALCTILSMGGTDYGHGGETDDPLGGNSFLGGTDLDGGSDRGGIDGFHGGSHFPGGGESQDLAGIDAGMGRDSHGGDHGGGTENTAGIEENLGGIEVPDFITSAPHCTKALEGFFNPVFERWCTIDREDRRFDNPVRPDGNMLVSICVRQLSIHRHCLEMGPPGYLAEVERYDVRSSRKCAVYNSARNGHEGYWAHFFGADYIANLICNYESEPYWSRCGPDDGPDCTDDDLGACDDIPSNQVQTRERFIKAHATVNQECIAEEQGRICVDGSFSAWTGNAAFRTCEPCNDNGCSTARDACDGCGH